jgi:hypothetical protein
MYIDQKLVNFVRIRALAAASEARGDAGVRLLLATPEPPPHLAGSGCKTIARADIPTAEHAESR